MVLEKSVEAVAEVEAVAAVQLRVKEAEGQPESSLGGAAAAVAAEPW